MYESTNSFCSVLPLKYCDTYDHIHFCIIPLHLLQVVTTWIDSYPEDATWPNLVEALTEMGQRKNAKLIAERRGESCAVLCSREKLPVAVCNNNYVHSTLIYYIA